MPETGRERHSNAGTQMPTNCLKALGRPSGRKPPPSRVRCQPGEGRMLFRSRTGALVLIIVGTLFLLSNLGWIPQLGPLLRQWWPLILIIVGIVMLVQR